MHLGCLDWLRLGFRGLGFMVQWSCVTERARVITHTRVRSYLHTYISTYTLHV